jgi:hypothetical protein
MQCLTGISAPLPKKVAFFAGLSKNFGPKAVHTDVPFDVVITNDGGGYEPTTGRFTAPFNATYQFNVVISAQGREKVSVNALGEHAVLFSQVER